MREYHSYKQKYLIVFNYSNKDTAMPLDKLQGVKLPASADFHGVYCTCVYPFRLLALILTEGQFTFVMVI